MPEITDAELRQFVRFQNLGTPEEVEKKIRDLQADNHKYRQEEKPALEAKLQNLPPEGAVVLTGEEAKAYPALKELGKPEEIKAKLEKLPDLEKQIAERDRTAAREAAARALGIEGKDLSSFTGADSLTYEVREVEQDGAKRPVAYVKDAEGKEHPLADYGREKWGRPFEAVLDDAKDGSRDRESRGGTSYNAHQTGGGRKERKGDEGKKIVGALASRDATPWKSD